MSGTKTKKTTAAAPKAAAKATAKPAPKKLAQPDGAGRCGIGSSPPMIRPVSSKVSRTAAMARLRARVASPPTAISPAMPAPSSDAGRARLSPGSRAPPGKT